MPAYRSLVESNDLLPDASQRAAAERVRTLRYSYEQRATELLKGADKEAKQKLDDLTRDLGAQKIAIVEQTLPQYDLDDPQQGLALVRAIRDRVNAAVEDAEEAMILAMPETLRDKFAEVVRNNRDARRVIQKLPPAARPLKPAKAKVDFPAPPDRVPDF